jgi:endoglucanase
LDSDGSNVTAIFRGGVQEEYFEGANVRFFCGDEEVVASIIDFTVNESTSRVDRVKLRAEGDVVPGSLGMWDLESCEVTNGLVRGRAIDDLAGCGLILALFEALNEEEIDREVLGVFTRAEEIGFIGATGLANSGKLPPSLPIISLEMSKTMPGAQIGLGPVIRLGDRSMVFDGALVEYMRQVASSMKDERESFKWQQKLMDGGSCEATAFSAFGFRSAGVVLPLGNYHNQPSGGNGGSQGLCPEEISSSDYCDALAFLVEMVRRFEGLNAVDTRRRRAMLERSRGDLAELETRYCSV